MVLRKPAGPIIRGDNMARRFALAGLAATALVACATIAAPAAAGNVAWGVTLGVPGFAVSAGQPAYGAWGGPYYRPVAPIPYAVAPPVVYPFGVPFVAAVVRPYRYPHYRPNVYRPAWRDAGAPVPYAYGYYGNH